ncbi:MAG: hypothetical protein UR31_C0007G0010 [Parcubacteria group bacterium GW2011_GWA2_33_14]|nr:MAG: hypothetical protein UR31_C0007G0010 [Parcubacteria group bacterium GW2011_GWA2_33_14]OGZ70985.1 MAG: hypothetical protein A2980_03190 [Candidatus Staskawiczbacteria bacterium RIFCSPLOWO2_01_FULL_33_13]
MQELEPSKKGAGDYADNPEGLKAVSGDYLEDLTFLITNKDTHYTKEDEDFMFENGIKPRPLRNEGVSSYFSNLMNGKVVLDLGCGEKAYGYKISDFAKAKEYMGVEKYFAKSAFQRASSELYAGKIPFEIIQEDMVDYVRGEHKADVVILVGIDTLIIPLDQWEYLLKRIYENLSDDGSLIMGGGVGQPKKIVEKYFKKEGTLDGILDTIKDAKYMQIPSVWKKK